MLRTEDYNKQNLEDCIKFLEQEINDAKIRFNSAGFTKYSPMGRIITSYRRELKKLMFDMREDLEEDFKS